MNMNGASIAAEKTKLHQAIEARSFKANGSRAKTMKQPSALLLKLTKKEIK